MKFLSPDQQGFSLVELSIVLVIIGLLVGTAVAPLSSSIKQARYKRTDAQLTNIREALLGYLISTGRLPCPIPLSENQSGVDSSSIVCSMQYGALPASTLGLLGERSEQGALLDAWGHEYLYSVTQADHDEHGTVGSPDWLTVGELAAEGTENLFAELQLCRALADNNCSQKNLIANQIVWVVYSRGESDAAQGLETENADKDTVFAISGYSSNKEQAFDDQVIWASRSELVYWLLKANWLP